MEAQSLSSHQHSWWFYCFSRREKLARSHNKKGWVLSPTSFIRVRDNTLTQWLIAPTIWEIVGGWK